MGYVRCPFALAASSRAHTWSRTHRPRSPMIPSSSAKGDHSHLWIVHAKKGLGLHRLSTLDGEDGLQFDVKGLLLNGHHESFSKLILPLDRTEQRGVTVDDLSFTTVLRCSNGMVQEGDRIRVCIRVEGEMQGGDRRSELDGEPSDVPTGMEPLKDAVCKILPILRIDDNGKLIPAIPEHLPLRNQLVQVLCDSFQQEIATTLPIGVVHSLEIVEADDENQRLPVVSANLVDTGDET